MVYIKPPSHVNIDEVVFYQKPLPLKEVTDGKECY